MADKKFNLKDQLAGANIPTRKTPAERNVELLGGGVEAKPHSTKKGRTAAAKRKFKRLFGAFTKEAGMRRFNRGGKV